MDSPVIFGGKANPHLLQGLGAGFIPSILNVKILDGTFLVSKEEGFTYVRKIAKKKEGILVGISTGAVLSAINKELSRFSEKSIILTLNYDTGERYLSVDNVFLIMIKKVIFISAGPGDPGLITIKALNRLKKSETVLVDRLVSPEINEKYSNYKRKFIFVGKKFHAKKFFFSELVQ